MLSWMKIPHFLAWRAGVSIWRAGGVSPLLGDTNRGLTPPARLLRRMSSNNYLQFEYFLAAADADGHFIARLVFSYQRQQIFQVLDRLLAESNNHVVRFQPGLFRRRIFIDLGDAALRIILVQTNADIGAAFASAPHFALGQPVPGGAISVYRDVKVHGHVFANAAVDADDLAVQIEERPAGVAADQGAIGADHPVAALQHPAQAKDGRSAGSKTFGMTQGQAPGAWFQLGGVAHLDERPLAFLGNANHAAVQGHIGTQRFALEAPAVRQEQEGVAVGFAADVAGRQHVAVFVDDDAAAGGMADADADHSRRDLLHHLLDALLNGAKILNIFRHRLIQGRRPALGVQRRQHRQAQKQREDETRMVPHSSSRNHRKTVNKQFPYQPASPATG